MYNYLQSYIDSGYFIQLHQFSGISSIIHFLEDDKYLRFLVYLSDVDSHQICVTYILGRIKEIENIKIEEKYTNPYDIELTVLAWFLYKINEENLEKYDISNIKNTNIFRLIVKYLNERKG